MVDAVAEFSVKRAKGGEGKRKSNANKAKGNKERTALFIQFAFVRDSSELLVCKKEKFA